MNTTTKVLQDAIQALNVGELAKEYQQHEMLVIKDFLPPELVIEHFVPQVERCVEHIHRVYVPGFKKSGSVSYHKLEQYAPHLFQIYQASLMKAFIETIVSEEITYCPDSDQHAAALYYYTEPGDHIAFHYDKSFYKGKRFTVLLGMIQDSEHSKLVCYPNGPKKEALNVMTHPGTLVIFNGDVLWHKVTPLAENERRAILTLEYVTNPAMSFYHRFISTLKDRFLYFGKNEHQKA